MSGTKYWVWLSMLRGLSSKARAGLMEHFDSARDVFFASAEELRQLDFLDAQSLAALEEHAIVHAENVLDVCAQKGISVITRQDAAYPRRLANIYDPPAVLYVMGRLPSIDDEAAVAVVGTRTASVYGLRMGRRLGSELAEGGAVVLTGLAKGVDSAAAEGALAAEGCVVGVLGTAIDVVYPAYNGPLFDAVMRRGALVSEYPPGYPTMRENFPRRNRILSGLALGTVIVEAPEKSGALITARHALEQGRDVYAVPGNADSENCAGANALLKEGARPVTSGWDILSEYVKQYPHRISKPTGKFRAAAEKVTARPVQEQKATEKAVDNSKATDYIDLEAQLKDLTERQLKIVTVLVRPAMHVDDIVELTGLDARTVLAELTFLQIKGYVRQEKGKRYSLNIKK